MTEQPLKSFVWAAVLCGGLAGSSLAQAQPAISGITPDGSVQFQASPTLSFNVSSAAAVTNITVTLNGTKMNGSGFVKVYTHAAGLTINGTNVSAPVLANTRYSASIQVTDGAGASASSSVSFDTITPAYVFESEDFDYDGGKYIDNPQTNAYRGLTAVADVDAYNTDGNSDYRPSGNANAPGGLATEGCGDKTRVQYVGTGMTDYDVGWTGGGDWGNYTRHYPKGTWNIYVRASNPNSAQANAFELYLDGNLLGQFAVPNTGGWQTYTFVPLTDSTGAIVDVEFDGNVHTLQEKVVGGSYNMNYFMFLPKPTAPPPTDVELGNLYPDGGHQFQATNLFAFEVTSASGINPADITVQLGATTLEGVASSKILTAASGLTIAPLASGFVVKTPVTSNLVYNAFIQVDQPGKEAFSTNILFDTITPACTWEAEDWDYNGGQFFDNPQTNSYTGLDGIENVDFARPSTGGGSAYSRVGLASENASDVARWDHDGFQDYDIGNNGAGNWVNYTRTWPAGIYNVYIRIANGTGTSVAEAGYLSSVDSGLGTENQQTTQLGSYSSAPTGGWQKYVWRPLRDSGGNLMRFKGGSVKTLRHTVTGGNANQGFYLLMPADPSIRPVPYAGSLNPDGSKMFSYTNVFSFTANSAAGINADGIQVTIDGINMTKLTVSGTEFARKVSCPIGVNAFHTAVIVLHDAFGGSTNRVSFATFQEDKTYIFEAEDYDYSGGQFFDNPQVNAYAGADALPEIDTHVVSGFDGTHVPYRPSGLNQENCSDVFLAPGHAGSQNYDLGNTVAGNWGNYTRTYPAGVYNIYMRAANGNTGNSSGGSMQIVTAGRGTVNQTTVNLGTFDQIPPTGGWQNYTWVALRDSGGKLAEFTGGSVKTLRAICGGGQNNDYYALVPVDTTRPSIANLYPNGAMLFQRTNKLAFNATSSAGINTNEITVTLNGVAATGLAFTGSSTNWTVSYPNLQPDKVYTATISMTSSNGLPALSTIVFDTFSPAYYTWEAEDFDYGGGKYFDNPQTNAYRNMTATGGVDANNSNGGGAYRAVGTTAAPGGLATENCGDQTRAQYVGTGMTDYDVGYTDGGDWANYTRRFPAGTYNIYMRGANPNASGSNSAEISGPVSGHFAVPNTGGWQIYTYVPLIDASGNLVEFTTTGAAQTVKISTTGGSYNANFYMLVPATAVRLTAIAASGGIDISFRTQTGSNYQLQYKSALGDSAWTNLGSAITGDNTTKTVHDSPSGGARFYRLQVSQ